MFVQVKSERVGYRQFHLAKFKRGSILVALATTHVDDNHDFLKFNIFLFSWTMTDATSWASRLRLPE